MESEGEDESNERENIIIAEEYEEDYVSIADAHQTIDNINPLATTKGKYYKQTYRSAWEHMPDFKGWLRGVAGEPTRAYCIYCQKTLHAHRLSLLKHTCTIRHQKAAQLHLSRKTAPMPKLQTIEQMQQMQSVTFSEGNTSAQEEDGSNDVEVTETMIHYATSTMDDENEDDEQEEDDEEQISLDSLPVQFHKIRQQMGTMPTKPPISTHVFDTSKGTPVVGLQVSLYKLIDGRWTYINEGVTHSDGRFSNFLEQHDFTLGRYKLHFDVDRYFEQKKQESLYPFIEIVFDSRSIGEQYHIPLLLSPFGYTTYRGS